MGNFDEDKIFNSLEIRNTDLQTSDVAASGEFIAKTIFIENGLNQTVTFQLQGARDGTWLNVGSTFEATASTNLYQTVSDFFPKYRLTAQCSVAPTSGSLSVWILKSHGG